MSAHPKYRELFILYIDKCTGKYIFFDILWRIYTDGGYIEGRFKA